MKLKKIFSALLALVLVLGIMPVQAGEVVGEYCEHQMDKYVPVGAQGHEQHCSICGYQQEPIDILPHEYVMKSGKLNHWLECSVCGYKEDAESHKWGEAKEEERIEPQIGIPGGYYSSVYCTVCGWRLSKVWIEIPALEPPPAEYAITFKNENGEVIYTTTVTAGTVPSYPYGTLTKEENGYVSYSFAGWSPAPYAADKDETYTAVFTETTKYYDITFKNMDGTVLQKIQQTYGEYPSYSGETPTLPEDKYATYEFSGWMPSISRVTGNTAYSADYKQIFKYYDVKFMARSPDNSKTTGNGNYVEFQSQHIRAGARVTDPGPSGTARLEFQFWAKQSDLDADRWEAFDFENETVTEDFILEAVYKNSDGKLIGSHRGAQGASEGDCYIATFLYGSYDCPPVWVLRRFRDKVLKQNDGGRQLVGWYYENAEGFVEQYGENPLVCAAFLAILDTGVELLKSLGFEDTEYTDAP